jgi:hypothetical protein
MVSVASPVRSYVEVDKAKPCTDSMGGLNLAAVRLTTIHLTRGLVHIANFVCITNCTYYE